MTDTGENRNNAFVLWLEWAPSCCWFLFMVIPILIQRVFQELPATRTQLFSAVFVLAIFLATDAFAAIKSGRYGSFGRTKGGLGEVGSKRVAVVLMAALAMLSIANVAIMPRVPLLLWVYGGSSGSSPIYEARELATKALPVPMWLSYMFNWAMFVCAPVAVATFWWLRNRIFAMAVLLVAMLYALLSMAKFPAMFVVFCTIFALAFVSERVAILFRRFAFLSLFLFGVGVAFFLTTNWEILRDDKLTGEVVFDTGDPRAPHTIADRIRMLPKHEASGDAAGFVVKSENVARYLAYRMFFVPADVALRWFQYYSLVTDPVGWKSVIPPAEQDRAHSRVVGKWAYVEKFPHKYLAYINAYASFDADAFSRGGSLGVFLATLLVAACRIFIVFFRGPSVVCKSMYGVALAFLSALPMQSSVQAILGSNGLFFLIAFMGAVSLCWKNQ